MFRQFIFFLILTFFLPLNASAEYFSDTVKDLLSEQLGSQVSVELRFESEAKHQKIIKAGEDVKSISLSFFAPESKSFKVTTTMADDSIIEIFGKYETFYEILVASRFIKTGEAISESDVRLSRVKRLKAAESAIKDAHKIFGMEAKSNILPGQVIKLSELKNPPIIRENDPVTLLYVAKDISLKTLGIAVSSGAIGEKIRVKNEKTGIVVFGEILDKNIVMVSSSDAK